MTVSISLLLLNFHLTLRLFFPHRSESLSTDSAIDSSSNDSVSPVTGDHASSTVFDRSVIEDELINVEPVEPDNQPDEPAALTSHMDSPVDGK